MKNHFITFVDLDGVVADYDLALLRAYGLTRTREISDKIKSGMDVSDILGQTWVETKSFLQTRGKEHWEHMDIFPWTYDLYETLKKYGEVAFLTSTGKVSLPAAQGKQDWCYKHFKNHDIIIAREKYFCAKPNSLLLDDDECGRKPSHESNVLNFEKWGGNAIFFPNYQKILDGDIKYDDFKESVIKKIQDIKENLKIK